MIHFAADGGFESPFRNGMVVKKDSYWKMRTIE